MALSEEQKERVALSLDQKDRLKKSAEALLEREEQAASMFESQPLAFEGVAHVLAEVCDVLAGHGIESEVKHDHEGVLFRILSVNGIECGPEATVSVASIASGHLVTSFPSLEQPEPMIEPFPELLVSAVMRMMETICRAPQT